MPLCGVTCDPICAALYLQTSTKEEDMNLSSRVQELKKRHQSLSKSVEELQRNPATDDLEIAKLKKQKLMIKEEITRLSAH